MGISLSDHNLAKRAASGQTYSGVDGLIALHLAVLTQPVVRLAKGDAWQAVRDQAQVDRAAAAEERVVPRLGRRGRGALDVVRGLGEHRVQALLPVLDVMVVDGAGGGLLWTRLGISWGCHF